MSKFELEKNEMQNTEPNAGNKTGAEVPAEGESSLMSEEEMTKVAGAGVNGFCCNWCGLSLPNYAMYAAHMRKHIG